MKNLSKMVMMLTGGVLSISLSVVTDIKPSVAQTCNVYGCSQPGAGDCNVYGCPKPGAGACNVYGCSQPGAGDCNVYGCPKPGAGACNVYGCPAAPQGSSPPPSGSSQNATASDRRNFTIFNKNSQTITNLYVSSTDINSWGRDILPGVLSSGSSIPVTFSDGSERCLYDVMVVYRDKTYDRGRHNLCQTPSINYTGSGGDYAPK